MRGAAGPNVGGRANEGLAPDIPNDSNKQTGDAKSGNDQQIIGMCMYM